MACYYTKGNLCSSDNYVEYQKQVMNFLIDIFYCFIETVEKQTLFKRWFNKSNNEDVDVECLEF